MSSPFSMLSRLNKARRASKNKVPGVDESPPNDIARNASQSSLRSLASKARKGLKGVGGKDGKSDSAVATPSGTPPGTPSLAPSPLPISQPSDIQSASTTSSPVQIPAAAEKGPVAPEPVVQKAPDADWTDVGSTHDAEVKDNTPTLATGMPERSAPERLEAGIVLNEAVVGSNEAAIRRSKEGSHDTSSFESADLLEVTQSVSNIDEKVDGVVQTTTTEAVVRKVGNEAAVDVTVLQDEKDKLSLEVQRLQAEISAQADQTEQRIAAVEAKKDALGKELEALRKAHDATLVDEESLSKEVDRLRNELSVQASQASLDIAEVEQAKANLSQELERLKRVQIVVLEKEKKDLAAQLQRIHDDVSHQVGALENEKTDLHAQVERLREETAEQLSQREERIVAVELQKGHLSQELRRMEEALTDARKEKKLVEESLSDVEQEKSSMTEDIRRLQDELTALAQEKEACDEQLNSLDSEREQLAVRVNMLEDELMSVREDADAQGALARELELELADVKHEYTRFTQEANQFKEDVRRIKEETKKSENRSREEFRRQLEAIQEKCASLERHNHMLQDQVHQQAEEFASAYSTPFTSQQLLLSGFLGNGASKKLNAPTGEGVSATMNSLNIAIFQAAASLADDLYLENGGQVKPITLGVDDEAALISRMTEILGREVILVLRSTDQVAGQDPLPMQIALQAAINYCCTKIMTSWYPGHWYYGDFLGVLYARVQGSEDPETALKWRCVTRRQCNASLDTQSHLLEFIRSHLADVLAVAGWSSPSLLAANAERVSVIVRLALRLNKLIGEDTGPGHIEPLLVAPEIRYDTNIMDNAYADDNDDLDVSVDGWASERVICTTELGLQRIAKLNRRVHDESADGATYGHVLLRPKVVLRSVLEQL